MMVDHWYTTTRRGEPDAETWQADRLARLGGGRGAAGVGRGAALAAQSATTSTTQAPSAGGTADTANKARAGALGRGAGWRQALGRRVLHGEATVQTREGVKTLVMARGQVTALTKDAITIKSSDGVETSFAIDADTRFGLRNQPAPSAELKVGEDALVAGERSGNQAVAKRVVSGDPARRGAGKDATP
jgi:hypothetical protein